MLKTIITLSVIASMQSAPLTATNSASFETKLIAPYKNQQMIRPVLYARSAIAIDTRTGTVLFEQNADIEMPIASLTKMMTILIVLEENELTDEVTISSHAASEGGSQIHVRAGDTFTTEALIESMIIASGNDAAIALAEFNAGSVSEFVEKMNQKAKVLGMNQTSFANSTGLDHYNNYSTAKDIVILSSELLKHDVIQEFSKKSYGSIQSINTGYTYNLTATNKIIDNYLNVKGLKTGTTPAAKECLAALADGPDGNEVLTIILGSDNRFHESKILLDWVYRAYTW